MLGNENQNDYSASSIQENDDCRPSRRQTTTSSPQDNIIMKQIEVVAAIIRDADGRIFATQRGYGEWKDWWEFPGGKMEAGETTEEALRREIREELSTEIDVGERLCTVEYDYPKFHLTMHCHLCSLRSETLHLNEHEAARWLGREELDSVEWLPADWEVVERLKDWGNENDVFC